MLVILAKLLVIKQLRLELSAERIQDELQVVVCCDLLLKLERRPGRQRPIRTHILDFLGLHVRGRRRPLKPLCHIVQARLQVPNLLAQDLRFTFYLLFETHGLVAGAV